MMKKVAFGDIIIALIVLCVIITVTLTVYQTGEGESEVYIEAVDGSRIYPLDTEEDVIVTGPIGETHIRISGGVVSVEESDCQDKTCISMGQISDPGEWIACLPNRVVITIRGGSREDLEVDDVVY